LKDRIIRAAVIGLCSVSASVAFAGPAQTLSDGSVKIAEGVYQRTEPDGTIIRMAYGDAGARYERELLTTKIEGIKAHARTTNLTKDELDTLAEAENALAALPPPQISSSPQPLLTTSNGGLCQGFNYGLDVHLVAGSVGATVVSRASINLDGFGPPATFTAISARASSTVTPMGQSSITVTRSNTTGNGVTSVADWNVGPVTTPGVLSSTACTASASSSVSVTSPNCPGGSAFVSLNKTYTTCVSAP